MKGKPGIGAYSGGASCGFVLVTVAVSALNLLIRQAACGADWPQWRGPDRDGVSHETGWLTQWPPSQMWVKTNIGAGYASVAVSEGRLYTMGMVWRGYGGSSNFLYCFDAATGDKLWASGYPYDTNRMAAWIGPRATPTVAGNEVYTYDEAGLLCCFDKNTGSLLWNKVVRIGPAPPIGQGYCSSPLVEGNLVIINGSARGAAVDRNPPHNIVWPASTPSNSPSFSSPVALTVDSRRMVVVQSDSALMGIDPVNGGMMWSYTYGGGTSAGDPVIFGNKLFLYEAGGKCLQVETNGVTAEWTASMSSLLSSAVIMDNYAYFVGMGGVLYCIDLHDGAVKWSRAGISTNTPGWTAGPMIGADGKLIIFTDGRLRIAKTSPSGYDEEGRVPVTVATLTRQTRDCYVLPVLSNGKIYCRRDSLLVCYQVGPNPPADVNSNGLADSWEQINFGTNSCLPEGDADGDGISNLAEYLAGTSPTNRASEPPVQMAAANGDILISWPTILAAGIGYEYKVRSYDLLFSTNLVAGAWQGVPGYTGIPANDSMICYSNTMSNAELFYRIQVRLE